MKVTYKIHPAIGIARLGNSPDKFYISPETEGGLPIDVGPDGNALVGKDGKEQVIGPDGFRDQNGLVKRQAARFRIYVYDDEHPEGRELKIGDEITGYGTKGKLVDIKWKSYLANKKAVWYEFSQLEGEHGYVDGTPLRNASVTDSTLRQQLIIDPGPQTVSLKTQPTASFALGQNPSFAQTFPPQNLQPNSISTLGDMQVTQDKDGHVRLLLLGGHGNSGSTVTPMISTYANNDNWFDDISDGPVTATLVYQDTIDQGKGGAPVFKEVQVDESSWCIVGYPRYAPQITDMITTADLLYDLNVRMFGYNPYMYGVKPFNSTKPIDANDPETVKSWRQQANQYNPDYYPYFYRDIWPILTRPYNMQYTTAVLAISNDAHETQIEPGDFYIKWMEAPPDKETGIDKYKDRRWYVFSMLRRPGEENQLTNHHVRDTTFMFNKELMPLLCGDNPITNTLPSKFLLRLTDTQLFILRQWALGKFINEKLENIPASEITPAPGSGEALDQGVLSNMLGGAFCPGAETCWIIRNPALYSKPYRINANTMFTGPILAMTGPLSQMNKIKDGLEPGDITKYSGIPWQSDFNECSTQTINVTYELWNEIDTGGDEVLKQMNEDLTVLWWPSHRPMEVYQPIPQRDPSNPKNVTYNYKQIEWARGIQQTHAGDLKMVTEWSKLGFLIDNPYDPNASMSTNGTPKYVQVGYTGDAPLDWSLVKPA